MPARVTARVCALLLRDQFFRELSVKTFASRSARNFRLLSLSVDDHTDGVRALEKNRALKGVSRAYHSIGCALTVRTLRSHRALHGENQIGEINQTQKFSPANIITIKI